MNKTMKRETTHPIAVNIDELCAMLSCGEATAKQIAEAAEARVYQGKRVLYSVKKVENYIEVIAM